MLAKSSQNEIFFHQVSWLPNPCKRFYESEKKKQNDNKIIIADKYKTDKTWRKYKESIIEHTFYHELTHCILYYTGNKKLWLNERLVDSIGGMWLQYDKSKNNGKE